MQGAWELYLLLPENIKESSSSPQWLELPHAPPVGGAFSSSQWVSFLIPSSGWSFLIPPPVGGASSSSSMGGASSSPQWVELPHPPSGWASFSPQWVELSHPPSGWSFNIPQWVGIPPSPSGWSFIIPLSEATAHDTAQLCFLSEIFSHPYEVPSRGNCLSALLWYSLALTWDSKKLGISD